MKILGEQEELDALARSLGAVDPRELEAARLAVHWAVQPVASLGFTLLPQGEDFEHTTLRYRDGKLCGRVTDDGLHAGFAFEDATVRLLDNDGQTLHRVPIEGLTLEGLYDTMAAWLGQHGRAVEAMVRPAHDMPEHPVASGATFGAVHADARRELEAWLRLGTAAVEAVARSDARFGDVLMWPHHFDIATLMKLGGESTVGVGLTPGDPGCPEPYLYVTPWPYPDAANLPPLGGGGRWHTQGWTGAVLRAQDLVAAPAPERLSRLDEFLSTAVDAAVTLESES